MRRLERTPPLVVAGMWIIGAAVGLFLQMFRSSRGEPPIVTPLSLATTMLVIAGVLLVLGATLRRAITRPSGRPVNPFHAVRLLAGARAGQLAGALLGGLSAGLLAQVLTRTIVPAPEHWVPTLLSGVAGLVLVIAGVVTEWWCRVPPTDPEVEADPDPDLDPGEQPA